MDIEHIPGATRIPGKDQPEYIPLSIRDEPDPETGGNCMVSQWRPDAEDLAKLMLGAPLHLSILGRGHPPVRIYVGEVPAPAATMDVDGGTGPSQEVYVWRVFALNHPLSAEMVEAPNRQAAMDKVRRTVWPDLKDEDVDAERP